ncbi:MAG: glycosyl hydrolase [Candidatus Hodarchaeota archaeon]
MTLNEIYKKFLQPPRKFSPIPFWFLNNDLNEEELLWALDEFEKKHIYGAVLHPRTGLEIDYLSDEYFEKFKFIIEEMKKRNQFIVLYDEYNWPSGPVGGRLLREHPEFKQKYLDYEIIKLEQNKLIEFLCEGQFLAAFTINRITNEVKDVSNLFDGKKLTLKVESTDFELIIFNVKILDELFFATSAAPSMKGERGYIDLLNPAAVKYFIEQTHEKYKQHFREDFGKSIIGMFTDEPGNYASLMWTDDFPKIFKKEKNYDLIPHLYKLVYEIHDYVKVKNDYHDVALKLYEISFYKQIGDWCHENNIPLTGHLIMEEELHFLPRMHGGLFAPYRHFGIPGIDYLSDKSGYEIKSSVVLPNPNFTTKFISSISHSLGVERTLCEVYGGCGWQTTLEKLKNVMIWMAACGINLFNFHASHLSLKGLRKRDFPASHFVQEPWWNYYSAYSDMTMRLSYFNTIGIHKANIAVLFPKRSFWTEHTVYKKSTLFKKLISEFGKVGNMLLRIQMDYDYIFEEQILENLISIQKDKLKLKNEQFSVLVLPPMTTIPKIVYEFIKQYYDEGGFVISFGLTPENSPKLKNDPEIQAINSHIFGVNNPNEEIVKTNKNGGKAIFIPFFQFKNEIKGETYLKDLFSRENIPKTIKIESESSRNFIYQCRIIDNLNFYLVCNMSKRDDHVKISLFNSGYLEIWDPETGERRAFKHIQDEFEFNFKPYQALIFILSPIKSAIKGWPQEPLKNKELSPITLKTNWNIELESKNKYLLDNWDFKLISRKPEDPEQIKRNQKITKKFNKKIKVSNEVLERMRKFVKTPDEVKTSRYSLFDTYEEFGPILETTLGISLVDDFGALYELMEFFGVLAEKVGFKLKEFHPGDEFEISKKFEITEMPDEEIKFVYEDIGMPLKIDINGKKFDWDDLDEMSENYFVYDNSNRAIPIKNILKTGENYVRINLKLPEYPDRMPSFHGIEPYTLVGDFSVKNDKIYPLKKNLDSGDWSKQGLVNYSGGIWYKQAVNISKEYLKNRLFLEFSKVKETVEVKINGKKVGIRPWSPFKLEITNYVKEGVNELEILVTNTAANFFAFPMKSGILGTVKIVPYKK